MHENRHVGLWSLRRSLATVVAALAVALLVGTLLAGQAEAERGSQFQEAVRSSGGVIASESPAASEVGLSVLDGGGNAVDAAVASTFAMNVARPQSCGIGGGGFMVYRGADGEVAALDFRETAPAAIEPETFPGVLHALNDRKREPFHQRPDMIC